ncbi:hypothetical protein OROHE_005553 [Orobanche hederae]
MNYAATKFLPFSLLLHHTTADHAAAANLYTTKLHLCRHGGPPTYSLVQTVHANMLTSGFAPRGDILNHLIDLYCKASNFHYAKKLFDKIPEPNVVARTNLIAAYSASRVPKLAREVFEGTPLEMRDTSNKNGAMAMGGIEQIPMSDPPCMGAGGEAICKYNCMRRHGPDVQA